MADNMPTLRNDLSMVARKARLTSAVEDVDSIIARLLEARERIAAGVYSPTIARSSMSLAAHLTQRQNKTRTRPASS